MSLVLLIKIIVGALLTLVLWGAVTELISVVSPGGGEEGASSYRNFDTLYDNLDKASIYLKNAPYNIYLDKGFMVVGFNKDEQSLSGKCEKVGIGDVNINKPLACKTDACLCMCIWEQHGDSLECSLSHEISCKTFDYDVMFDNGKFEDESVCDFPVIVGEKDPQLVFLSKLEGEDETVFRICPEKCVREDLSIGLSSLDHDSSSISFDGVSPYDCVPPSEVLFGDEARNSVVSLAKEWGESLDVDYVGGALGNLNDDGDVKFDCSGFVAQVLYCATGIDIKSVRSSIGEWTRGDYGEREEDNYVEEVGDYENMQPGGFYGWSRVDGVGEGHVVIYISNNEMCEVYGGSGGGITCRNTDLDYLGKSTYFYNIRDSAVS